VHALEKLSQSINRWIEPLLFGLGPPDQAEAFRREFDLSFPIVCDSDRRLYAAYGLKKMGLLGFASPSLLVKGVKALGQGHSMGIPTGDIYQLPGVFIIDTTGRIRFSHYARDPADHPSADTILSALSKIKP
jgi:peroxiredoxin